jgi:hypothetical protein
MTKSPSSSAQAARERVAAQLRDIRLDAALSAHEVALRCGWSDSKSSRLEHAKAIPSDGDIRAWCAACGAVGEDNSSGQVRPHVLLVGARRRPKPVPTECAELTVG